MKKVLCFLIFLASSAAFAANYTLSVGRFADISEAENLIKYLNSKDYPVYLRYGQIYEVRVGSFSSFEDARTLGETLRSNERIIARVVEDYNLESPVLKEHFNKKADDFIIDRAIADYRKQRLVKIALSFIYHPYIYGGQQVGSGIDCSYFVKLVFGELGIDLPRTSRYQFNCGDKVNKDELEIGDLVFFRKGKKGPINHVGIYFGNNEFIHATRGAKRVTISNLSENYYRNNYAGARRIFKKI